MNFWKNNNGENELLFAELLKRGIPYLEIKKILGYKGSIDALRHKKSRLEKDTNVPVINDTEPELEEKPVLIKKANSAEIYKYAFQGITDSINKYYNKPKDKKIKLISDYKKGKRIETANLIISDMHCGKKNRIYHPTFQKEIETYNDDIRRRMQSRLLTSVGEIVDLLKHGYYFEKLNLFILGDMIEGDSYVFEGQNFHVEKCVGLQMWDAVFDLVEMIKQLSGIFPKIEVITLVGNHSLYSSNRGMDMPVENYLEYHIYRVLELLFQENKNVKVTVPTSKFYSTSVYDHKFFLSHGDNIRGFSKTTRIKKAKDIYINLPEGFDAYCIGHFHSLEKDNIGDKGVLLTNGAWIPYDSYAQKLFGIYSEPKQWLVFTNKKRPVTLSFELDFRGVEITKGLIL